MTTSDFTQTKRKSHLFWKINRLRLPSLVILAILSFFCTIAVAWFSGERTVTHIFAYLNTGQKYPPLWLEKPELTDNYLLLPTVVLVLATLAIIKISPEPQVWSRTVVVGIMLALTLRYVVWRSLSTLNLETPLNGIFSIGLFLTEMLTIYLNSILLYLMLREKKRRQEADQMALVVKTGKFIPSVDILIPTYNEPIFILKRTIVGCQALEYVNKKVYLLDDTRRPEIKKLAEQLGCEYITRPDNSHAKAGNLNHAIAKTNGELIVVFDADFIPTKNFLDRTVGFFVNEKVALVQTPQNFYNHGVIARNLGLENIIPDESEIFYRHIELVKDGTESVVCAGTSFIVRRSALDLVGGFVTDSLCEDYFTGVRLSAKGYDVIYLDEKLSAGLAPENIAAYISQRVRWAQGTLQAFFIDSNPLTISGLKFLQRLTHLEGLLLWMFSSISNIIFLLMPLAYSFLDILPVQATFAELIYFLLPYYLVQVTVFSWLNRRSRSAFLSYLYSISLSFPVAITVIQTMFNPFGKGFKVTPKGIATNHFRFNWKLAWPLLVLWVVTAISLYWNLQHIFKSDINPEFINSEGPEVLQGINLGWIWSLYNLVTIGIGLLTLLDAPQPDIYEWFELRRMVRLNVGDRTFWGMTYLISEKGAEVTLTQGQNLTTNSLLLTDNSSITLEILEEDLSIPVAEIEQITHNFPDRSRGTDSYLQAFAEFPTVRIRFNEMSLNQYRPLIEMLYCRPGQWKSCQTPSEWRSLLLLFKLILRPLALFKKSPKVKPISVSQI